MGTRLEVSHLAATPIGIAVRAESELTAIDRRKLTSPSAPGRGTSSSARASMSASSSTTPASWKKPGGALVQIVLSSACPSSMRIGSGSWAQRSFALPGCTRQSIPARVTATAAPRPARPCVPPGWSSLPADFRRSIPGSAPFSGFGGAFPSLGAGADAPSCLALFRARARAEALPGAGCPGSCRRLLPQGSPLSGGRARSARPPARQALSLLAVKLRQDGVQIQIVLRSGRSPFSVSSTPPVSSCSSFSLGTMCHAPSCQRSSSCTPPELR